MNVFDEALKQAVTPGLFNTYLNVISGDSRQVLDSIDADSVHLVVTDPPYFLDGLDTNWRKGKPKRTKSTAIGGLPVGMKFDPQQGKELQLFIEDVGSKMIRVLMPGAFALVFSQPRLSYRMAAGLEDAGFEIRDMYAWRFTKRAQFKAFTMNHFIDKMKYNNAEKREIKAVYEKSQNSTT